jgi:hypothetical protein
MRRLRILILCCLFAWPPLAQADMVLVANPQSGIERLNRDDVVNIFMGRYRLLASGITAEPIDLADDTGLRARFYRALVNKSLAEINAYWARLVFSGKTRPPRVLDSVDAALQAVISNPGALAYLERSQIDKNVRVVFELGD